MWDPVPSRPVLVLWYLNITWTLKLVFLCDAGLFRVKLNVALLCVSKQNSCSHNPEEQVRMTREAGSPCFVQEQEVSSVSVLQLLPL